MKSLAYVIAAVGLLAAGTSFADDEDVQTQTVRVMYPDLDLTTNKGTKLLFIRLEDASREVCGETFDTPYLKERREINQCQQAAVENAVMQVGQPRLTALYDKHYPHQAIPDSRVSVKTDGTQGLRMTARRG